jgi:hypothetical protein
MKKLMSKQIISSPNRPFRILSGDGKKGNDNEESEDQTLGSNAKEKPPRRRRLQLLQKAILSHSSTGIYFLVGKWRT